METRWRKVEDSPACCAAGGGRRDWRFRAPAVMGLLVCSAVLFPPSPALAQNGDEAEYRVKLAFLYNFAQFIQWPPETFGNSSDPLNICVAGPDPFQGEIEQSLRGRTAGGHPIRITRLKPEGDPKACQVVFVRASEKKSASKVLSAVKGSSTLTVGECKGFADQGGVINFTLDENKLRFEINLDAATQTRLKISSKLLALAKLVKVEQTP